MEICLTDRSYQFGMRSEVGITPGVPAARLQDSDVIRREHVLDGDQQWRLRGGRVLQIVMVRDRTPQRLQVGIGGRLLVAAPKRVKAGLVRLVINYENG